MFSDGMRCVRKPGNLVRLLAVAIFCITGADHAGAQSVSPTALHFNNVVVNQTSADLTVKLTNSQASTTLGITSITLPAGGYAVDNGKTTCGSSLAHGASCTIAVNLTPAAVGPVAAGNLSVVTTSPSETLLVALSGTGVTPTTLSATTEAFGNVVEDSTSADKIFTLKNNQRVALGITSITLPAGGYAIDTSKTTCGSSLAAGATCTIAINLTPIAVGPIAAGNLTIVTNAPNSPQTVALSGTGIAPVTLSKTALTLATTLVGNTSAAMTVTVTNKQNKVLHFTPFPITGNDPGDFAWTSTGTTPCGTSIAAGKSCVVSVTFTPQASGPRSATLEITDDASTSPQLVTLSGDGNATVGVTPQSITTFSTSVGTTSKSTTVTIKNNNTSASDTVTITSFQTSAGFLTTPVSCSPLPYTLAAGATCTVAVQFAPTIGGTTGGQLQVNDSALTSPQVVNLTGNGTNPLTVATNPVAIKPPNLIYPAQPPGTVSTPKSITLSNFESQAESFTVQVSGDYTLAGNSCSSGTINANSSCIIAVDFAPAPAAPNGSDNGTLTITDSAPGGTPLTVSLTGSVGIPQASVAEVYPGAGAAGTSVPVTITGNGYTHFSNSSVITFADTDSSKYPPYITIDTAPITAYSYSSGILTLTAKNNFTAGTAITVIATASTNKLNPLNGQSFSVLASGLSATQFEIAETAVTGAGAASATATTETVVSANVITATLNIASSASTNFAYGARNITIKTPLTAGGTESATLLSAFTIYDPTNMHDISVLNPNFGAQGQTLNVELIGSGTSWMQGVTFFNFGTGITINSTQINGSTDAIVNITISNTTTVGTRTILAMTGGEFDSSAAGAFQVNSNGATLASVTVYTGTVPTGTCTTTPVVEAQGWSGQICVTGSGTHFLDSATTVSIPGVIVGAVNVINPTEAVAQIAVPSTAPVGPEDVTAATGGEIETLQNSFTVTGSTPGLVSIAPDSGQQGQSNLIVTITGNAYTNFAACSPISADMTGEITVNSITPGTGPNTNVLTLNISISPYANVGGITGNIICGPEGAATLFPFGFYVASSGASIVSVTPNDVPQGGQVTLTLVGAGTIWNQAQTVAAFYPELVPTPVVNEINVQDNLDATLNITVGTNVPVGNYPFYLATGGQIVSATIHVYANTPSMTMSPANGLVPSSGTRRYSVSFTGQFTNWNIGGQGCATPSATSTVPVISGEGVTLSNFCVTSAGSATGTVTIAAGAPTNQTNSLSNQCGTARVVTFTTGSQIDTTCFNVTTTPVGIISITPPSTLQNLTTQVEIVGLNTHFGSSTNPPAGMVGCSTSGQQSHVLFGPEIMVNWVCVKSSTDLIASIATNFNFGGVQTTTTPGYQTVYVNTGTEQVTGIEGVEQVLGSFFVTPPASPTLLSVVPNSAPQGSSESVTITGSLTNWCQGDPGPTPTCANPAEAILGAGVTVSSLTITSPTTATAEISVSPTAPVGGNSVLMISGPAVVGGTGFNVTPSAAYIASVEPNFTCPEQPVANIANICGSGGGAPTGVPVVGQLQTLTLNLIGVGTHWLQGGTSLSFGSGVVIDALTINSPTTATAEITVLSSAPIGFATATAYTDGEVASLQQAIDIESGFPTLLAISPGGGEQGASMNLQVLGRFTHWDSTTNVAFNQDITVNSINVIDSQNLIANITVSPLAYVDFTYPCGHVLTVTTTDANEQVSTAPILDDYCVSQGAEEITSISSLSGAQGSTMPVTITGSATNFVQGETTVSFGDNNFQVGQINVTSPTSLTVPVGVSTAATTGFKTVTVTTLGQVASQQYAFTVLPTVAQLTEVDPYQAEQGQQLYENPPATGIDVMLTGQYTHFSSLSTVTMGAGIVVNSVTDAAVPGTVCANLTNPQTQLCANITIDPLSYPGGRSVTVTTPDVPCPNPLPPPGNGVSYQGCNSPGVGTGSEIVTANAFSIITGPAIISNVSPNTGNEGMQQVVFNITGFDTHWQQNYTQFYIAGGMGAGGQCPAHPYAGGPDLNIDSVIINSPTSATVQMSICPYALAGARSIYMQTAGESLVDSGAFVVTGGIPVIAYIAPGSGVQGNTTPIEFKIRGIDTNWCDNVSIVCTTGYTPSTLTFDSSITATNVQIDDNLNIEGILSISGTATPGYHVFTVTTGTPQGTQVLAGNFLVTAQPGSAGYQPPPAPYISYYAPSSGLPGQTFNISFAGQYTKWDPNPLTGTQCSFGSGIVVNSCQVLSPTSILANITITATTAQTNLIVFTTPSNNNETESAGFSVVEAVPTLTIVDPGSGMQGDNNLTVNILGQYTLFDSSTSFNFGSGITVNSVQILGPTIATATISINQLAALGERSVVATTADVSQVVGGAGFTVTPSLAEIASVTPNTAPQGTSINVSVTGSNTHWDGSTVFSFGDGIVVSNTDVINNTSATLTLSIPALASEGATSASAQTLGEVANLNNAFVVTAGTPYLLTSGPSSLPQQSSATFTILSQATNWTQSCVSVSYGAGITVSNIQVTGPTSLTVLGSVQATTPVGYRNLTVTCGNQVLTLNSVFYVSPGPAVINSVTPDTGGQGVNLPAVQIQGTNTNWCSYDPVTCPNPTTLTFPGVLVNSYSVTSPTTITANITPSDYAPAGQVSVTATTGGEVATGVYVFNITQTQPELLAVVPTSAPQAWTTQNVDLTADFTHFCDNVTTSCPAGYTPSVVSFGTGIIVNSVTVSSLTTLVANVTVSPTAFTGYRNVSVITGSEAVQIVNAFNVTTGPAAIASLNPASGGQNTTATIQVTGSQTHFNGSSASGPVTTASFGGGIVVTQVTVVDHLHANVNISIPSSVALGNYDVTLTTGGEVAIIPAGFQVTNGIAAITNVNPPTGTQGITESVTLTGLYTHFCDNVVTSCATGYTPSMVSFGSGINVTSISAASNTSLVANITISTTATVGSYTPVVTTGSEVASITGGFYVLTGVPALTTISPTSAAAGATTNVVINGVFTNFQAAFSQVSFGAGVTVNFITNVTTTQLTANITVASNAAVGNRTVTVTTNSQTVSLDNAFAVLAGTPVITQINPNYGNPGQTLSVTLSGLYTNWSSSTMVTMGNASSGISVGGQPAGSPGPVTSATATSVTFSISIASGAPLGPVEVTTTTGAEVEIVPNGFTVQPVVIPPPSVALVSPGPYSGAGLATNSSIIVVFSQPMMRSTINTTNITLQQYQTNSQQGYPIIPGSVTLDASGLVMTFTPTSLLPVNSQFLFQISSVQDATGNPLPGYSVWLYTNFTADSAAPTVVAANPPANDSQVGTNVNIQLQFSVPMSQGTENGLTVSSTGGTVAGTYGWNSGPYCNCGPGNILTFYPNSPLSPNTVYTVNYSSTLTDTAGNALTPGSFTFTTGSGADTMSNYSGPDFTSGIGNVGTNFAPRMNFAKPVNPIDINSGTLGLYNYDSGKYIPGTVAVAPDGMSAVFTPDVLLLPGTQYTFYQNAGYFDADGNYLDGNSGNFITGNGKDQTAPTVQLISPPASATGVPLNAQVTVLFSAPIDYNSVGNAVTVTPSGGSAIAGSASLASDQVTLTFVPNKFLQPGTTYAIQVSGYQDMVGNVGSTASSSFTTAGTAGGFAPIVLSTGLDASGNLITTGDTVDPHWVVTPGGASSSQPAEVVTPDQAGWSPDWSSTGYADANGASVITLNPDAPQGNPDSTYSTTFNLTGVSLTNLCLVGAIQGDPYGTLYLNGVAISGQYYPWEGFAPASIQLQPSMLNQGVNTLAFQFAGDWDGYEGFRLQAEIAICGEIYGSTTDGGGLTLVNETPANGAVGVATNTAITLTFNNSLDVATVNSTTLPVLIGNYASQQIAGTYTLSTTTVSNDTVTFTPDSPFPTNTAVYVDANYGPADLAGDQAGGYYANLTSFTTGGTATPASGPFQVTAFSPAANATGVGLRAPVVATFNRSLNLNSVSNTDFGLFAGDSQAPSCSSYSHSQDDATISFNCYPMPASSIMTAILGNGLTDWQGNGLVPYTSTFTTTYYDSNTNGSIISSQPGSGAGGVSNNVPLTIYTNLPINPATATAGIEVAENGTPLPGVAQVIDNGYALVFTPSTPYAAGALIQWWTTGSLMDTVYNVSFAGSSGYFYVAADTGTLTPTVQAMVPSAYSGSVALNAFVDLQFNTPLNSATVNSNNVYLAAATIGCGGAITPVTYVTGLPANEVRMVPKSELTAGTYYYVCVEPGLTSATSVPAVQYEPYFYVGSAADNTQPVVVSAVPFNGATNVGINVNPGFVFNKAIDPVSVNSNTFTVSNGGTALAGSYWFSSNDTRVEFVPNVALPAGTLLTMTLNGVLDQVGNAVNYSGTFTTGPGPDITSPYVVWSSATNGGSIPINAGISIQFSESMDVTTFDTCTTTYCGSPDIYLYDTLLGQVITATLSWNSNQTIAYLVPTAPLAAGRTYYFYVNSGTDLAGNSMSPNNIGWTIYADLEAPPTTAVIAFNPANGATSVGTNTQIDVQFSAPIDPTTLSGVTLKSGGSTIAVTPVLSGGNTVLQLVPSIPLAAGTTYTITVAGVKDTTGIAVATASSGFTTGSTYDISSLQLVNAQPADNSTVATNVTPQFQFNKPLNPVTVYAGAFGLYTSNPYVWVPTTVTLSADRTTVTLTPVNPLQPGTEYQFMGSAQDVDGNSASTGWYYFYTGSGTNTTAPSVTVNPPDGATGIPQNAEVIAYIGGQIDTTTVGQNAIQLTTGGNPVPGTVSIINNQEIGFVPSTSTAAPVGTYIGCFNDNSNRVLNGSYTNSGSNTVESCVATCNSQGFNYAGVQSGSQCFCGNGPYNSAGQGNACNSTCNGNSNEICGGSYANSVYTAQPGLGVALLAPSTTYKVNVGNFTDVNGNPIALASPTTFTTGSAASQGGLTLNQGNDVPAYNATSVSPGTTSNPTTITLQFSQILDPATVNTNTMPVMVGWDSNQALPGTWAVNGNTATFTPTDPYPYGSTIYVGACGGPTDVLGEVFASGQCWTEYLDTFTIVSGSGSQVGTFKVLSVNPPAGATNVLTNTPVSVTFSNPVVNGSWTGSTAAANNIQLYAGQGVQENGNNITISSDGRTLTFNNGALYNGTSYTITIPAGGITDDWGNTLANIYTSTFTTTPNPDYSVGNGSVIGTNPGNTSGVATNTLLTLYISRQVNASTLTGNLTVTVNGSVYPGAVTTAADGYEVQYSPQNPFPNSATVQWWFSNAQDVDGVTISSASGYFYTAAPAPAPGSAPIVIAESPSLYDSTTVPTNAEFDIEYDLPLLASTVNSTNVTVYDSINGWEPTSEYDVTLVSSDVIRVQANPGPFGLNDSYYVCVGTGVTGTNLVPVSDTCGWTDGFTTTYGPDTSSGTVAIGPPNGATNVGTNAYFFVSFSKPMDQTTIGNVQVTNGGNPVPGSWSYYAPSGNVYTAYFSPTNPLAPNTTYKISASGVLDYAGNTFTSATSTFTTGPMPEYYGPSVTLDFSNGATGIATNASFTCHYSEPMDPSTLNSSGLFVWSYVDNAQVPATITVSADWTTATITPTTALYANTNYYYACYNALDLTGNAQNNANASFTTANGVSSAGPVLVYANPPSGFTNVPLNSNQGPWNNTSFDLLFSEAISNQSFGSITLTSQQQLPTVGPVVSVPIAASSQDGGWVVSIQLGEALLPNTLYTFNFAGVTDVNGNPVSGTTTTSFTTGTSFDSTTPTTASTVPANGAANVSLTGPFSMTFNEAMNPILINPSEIYLQTDITGTYVPATVTVSSDYTTVTVVPSAPLAPATIYDLVYWPNDWYLEDIAGNVDYNYGVWSTFTTESESAVNGACGSANGGSFAMTPNANLCSAGIASTVTNPGLWNWTCNGQYGGTNASCSATVTYANSCAPQQPGLVSFWPGNNNTNDLIGGNNGTLENGAGYGLGEVDDAFSLDGADQYVLIAQPVPANLQIQNAITLSAWIYPTAYPTTNGAPNGSPTWGTILGSQEESQTAAAAIFFNGNQNAVTDVPIGAVVFNLADGSAWHQAFTTTQVPLNQWTLVTATATADNPMQVYFNGVAQPTVNGGSSEWTGLVSYGDSSNWFAIGQESYYNYPFNGLINEAQVYKTALSTAQIQALYQAGSAGTCQVQTATTTTLASSQNPATVGSSVTFTATISPSAATGNVTFMDGSTTLGSAPVSGGKAQYSTSALAFGTHSITALYSGSTTYGGSVSAALSQAITISGSEACAPQPAGLIDWYPGNGNTNDIIGGNNGVVEGSLSYATGVVGQAFDFSRSGDVSLSLPSINTGNGTQVTVSFWMNWNGAENIMPFGFNIYDLYLSNGSFGFNTGNSDIWGMSSSGLANQWVQVTAVFTNGDPHNNQLYINGVQQTLSQQLGSTPNSASVATAAKIGSWDYDNNYRFDGLIDEVQIFNGALIPAEVQLIYEAGAVGVCTPETSTTTSISSSLNPANAGDFVTFTANVSPSSATGTVTFLDGATILSSPVSLSSGQATLTTAALTTGSNNITALYSGDTTYAGSVSGAVAQIENPTGQCDPEPSGLVSWWTGNGSTADILGANNPSASNAVSYLPAEVGTGFTFGSGGYIDIPDSSSLNNQNFTWTAWVEPEGPGPNNDNYGSIIVGQQTSDNSSSAQLNWAATNNKFIFLFGATGTEQIISQDAFPPGQFYLVTATYDGSTFKLYVNGNLEGTYSETKTVAYGSGTWTIGSDQASLRSLGYPRTWNGVINQVQAYNVALSQSAIQAIYSAGAAGMCTNAVSAINGACGSSNGGSFATMPTSNLCSAGAASYVTDNGSWNWDCIGSYGGSTASCSATNTSGLACVAPPGGLIDWWPGNGNADDIVGGNTGAITGTMAYSSGEVGQAFNFGNTAYMSATAPSINTAAGTQVTTLFWMKLEATAEEVAIVLRNNSLSYDNDLLSWNGYFGFNVGTSDLLGISNSGLIGNWVFVAAVWTNGDPHNNQLYINGVQQTLTQELGSTPTSDQLGENVLIGSGATAPYYFDGLLDEVQIYNGALTAAQIQAIYNAGAAGVCQ